MMLFKILNDAKVPEHCRRHEWRIHTTAKNVFVTKTRAGAKAFINHQSEDEIIAQSILMSPEAYSDVTGGDAWFQLSCHSASF